MPDHLPPAQLERYRLRTLDPRALLAADDHLAKCPACRERLAGGAPIAEAFDALRRDLRSAVESPPHVGYDELAAYADGTLDAVDREVVEGHLALCPSCAAEARELTAFRDTLASTVPTPARERPRRPASVRWLPVPIAAAAVVAVLWLGTHDLLRRGDEPRAGLEAPATSAPRPTGAGGPRVALQDAPGTVTLDGSGRLAGLPGLTLDDQEAVTRALRARRVDAPPFLADLIGRRGTLLAAPVRPDERFEVLGPVGTAVTSTRPTFRWGALPGATSYTVAVFDADYAQIAAGGPLRGLEWRPARPLVRGREYAWQVTAVRNRKEVVAPSAPAPEARFRVLKQERVDHLERVRSATSGSHLAMGVLYAEAGLVEDAERELRELAQANSSSGEAQALLRSLEAWRRPR